MEREDRLTLQKVSAIRFQDVAKADDALHASLAETIATERKASTLALFESASDELKGLLEGIDYTAVDLPRGNLRDVILKALKEKDAKPEVLREAADGLQGVETVGILPVDSLAETPVENISLFRSALNEAEVIRLAGAVRLSKARQEKLLERASSIGMITDAKLGELVKDRILTKGQASNLGLAASLYAMVDDRIDLTKTLRSMNFAALVARRLEALSEIALISVDDWKNAIERSRTALPEGVSSRAYAQRLRRRATKLFPTTALMAAVLPAEVKQLHAPLEQLTPLAERNEDLLSKAFDELDIGEHVPDETINLQRDAHAVLRRFANINPGLGIIGILNGNGNAAEKIEAIEKRLGLVKRFTELNPDVAVLSLDTRPDSAALAALKWDGLRLEEQKMVLANIKAHQRTFALTRDIDDAVAILGAGYHSATAVASAGLPRFVADVALPEDTATAHYMVARDMADISATSLASLLETPLARAGGVPLDLFNHTPMSNVDPAIEDYLRKIDGYTDFFGSLDYCRCEHCRSIFSPAAYFVDLMYFVEVNVLNHPSAPRPDHALHLRTRREDLWTLPLTCDNTKTPIPTLDIINEILENYIARRRSPNIDLTDRRAVEERVYRQELAGDLRPPPKVSSFRQPFVLPLERLQLYLAHFELNRGDVATTLAAPPDGLAIATLGLSRRAYTLITTPDQDPAFLRGLYGVDFVVPRPAGPINFFDAQDMLRHTGISRRDLTALAGAGFVTNGGTAPFRIVSEKRDANSVQNDIENIHDLTFDHLDRIHRFIRLQRCHTWSVGELDLVLGCLGQAGLANGIDGSALENLVHVLALEKRWKLTAELICALWSETVPRRAVAEAKPSLFDRLFNFPPFLQIDGPFPKPGVRFVHPAFRQAGTSNPNDNTLHRLLAALQINDEELAQLLRALAPALTFDPADANEDNRGPLLTEDNLALLYRHAKIAQLLRLSVPKLFQLIELGGIGGGHIAGLRDVIDLIELYDWLEDSGFKADEIGVITGGPVLGTEALPSAAEIAERIVDEIAKEQALQFAETVFAFDPNVTEMQSKAIIEHQISEHRNNAAPATVEELDPERRALRLAVGFDPENAATTFEIPPGIPAGAITEPDAKRVLSQYHPRQVLSPKLAAALSIPVEKISALIAMTDVDLASRPIVDAAWGGAAAPLEDLVSKLIPLGILFRHAAFDAVALTFIRDHKDRFGINRFDAIDVLAVRKLSVYSSLAGVPADAAFRADPVVVDADAVQQAIIGYHRTNRFDAAFDPDILGRALRTEASLVKTILAHVTLPTAAAPGPHPAPEALRVLKGCVELAHRLGIDGHALRRIIADGYEDIARAAEAVLSAFRAKYRDETEFAEKLEPFENRLRGRRRDALVDYLISSIHPEFESTSDLFHHFLIDVELEGCARTSRVAAAISSLQLYVHRIRMNLEQDRRDPADPQRVHIPPNTIPVDEWTWRKNYRVWEANRKVFLYPESYIEPDLRDDKTPLFQELESTLLQQEINEQTVQDAYARYLSGFEEIANLRIAGSFHDINVQARSHQRDVLHLFGVTSNDPPVYYYRNIENSYFACGDSEKSIIWGPWRKLDLQIPARKVSPVMYLGRLFVFWVEFTTLPLNKVEKAESKFDGYEHRMVLKYATLRVDGTWTVPQKISLQDFRYYTSLRYVTGWHLYNSADDGVIRDWLRDSAGVTGNSLNQPIYGSQPAEETWENYALVDYNWQTRPHTEPLEGYSLKTFLWDRVYPVVHPLNPTLLFFSNIMLGQFKIDFVDNIIQRVDISGIERIPSFRYILCSKIRESDIPIDRNTGLPVKPNSYMAPQRVLYISEGETGRIMSLFYGDVALRCDERRIVARAYFTSDYSSFKNNVSKDLYQTPIAEISYSDDIDIINGSYPDAVLSSSEDTLLLQAVFEWPDQYYSIRRLSSTLTKTLISKLFSGGFDGLLAISFQNSLGERPLSINILQKITDKTKPGVVDFAGSFGAYFRELFFHIPFLIANHLNSQQRFAAAQRWYHFILDPTASETTVPATDRVWRYIEFRGLGVPALREILEDPKALGVYLKDPFNPHAIARLRLSAYQKTIYMKYIDNLLDWGDSLYAQYTAEAINEAMLLYVLASDMLGPRPAELGDCGEGAIEPTYESIAHAIRSQAGAGSAPILIELENHAYSGSGGAAMVAGGDGRGAEFMIDRSVVSGRLGADVAEPGAEGAPPSAGGAGIARPYDWNRTITGGWTTRAVEPGEAAGGSQPASPSTMEAPDRFIDVSVRLVEMDRPDSRSRSPGFARSVVAAMGGAPAFCVPENKELRQYWDRVEDRLFKIRNCMDIAGVRRELALFAPEIDPRLLVRARAAGLSLEDVLNAINGDLPPYRFTYLIEKAKAYAATLQGFGSALLGAIERRDSEELNRLRTVHQQNILEMSTKLRDIEIETASEAYDQLDRQRQATTYRRDYYSGLQDTSLTQPEKQQEANRHIATNYQILSATFNSLAGTAYFIPQLGSPFTLEYGGKELGDAASAVARIWAAQAAEAEAIGASAGLQAGFQRREEGWEHQEKLAEHELAQIEKQLKIAELRKDTAARSKEIHDESIKQIEEVYAFNQERFSNFGLYTYLSATLQGVFREAYNNALAMARLAEQAYRFERGDDQAPVLQPSYWETGKAGLLAGEKLFIDLQNLERRFLETNYRSLEIDQPFSLSQINPGALLQLKQGGECTFSLLEVFFDLAYPGQYRRRIRSVRLTIPCVTGPFTNVGATLSLKGSSIRREPKPDAIELKPVPLRRSVTIASSTAQNDAGVFEFSFRDERYMPFEGAGAVSEWSLSLPKAFKPFDYQTITEVVLHVSYTAEYDGNFREVVEQQNAALEGTIQNVLSNEPLARAFSLRQDFSTAFHRLLHSPADTEVKFAINGAFLPYFLKHRNVVVTAIKLGLRTAPDPNQLDRLTDPGGFEIALDGLNPPLGNFTQNANLGNLWAQNGRFVPVPPNHPLGKLLGEHSLTVKRAGALAPQAPQPGDPSALDADKLLDVILYVEYHI